MSEELDARLDLTWEMVDEEREADVGSAKVDDAIARQSGPKLRAKGVRIASLGSHENQIQASGIRGARSDREESREGRKVRLWDLLSTFLFEMAQPPQSGEVPCRSLGTLSGRSRQPLLAFGGRRPQAATGESWGPGRRTAVSEYEQGPRRTITHVS